MKESIRKDILHVLKDSLKAIQDNDALKLREVSDHIIHDCTVSQEDEVISVAVIIYSLSKIFDKWKNRSDKKWIKFRNNTIADLEKAFQALNEGNITNYKPIMQGFFKNIGTMDDKLGMYINRVIDQAKIKKGSRVYEHGLSLSRAAKILDVSIWELMNYLGNTKIVDQDPVLTKRVKDRLIFTRGLFK